MKKEELIRYAKTIASIRTRMEMEDEAYEAIAEGIERGIKEVMLKAFRRLETVENLPIGRETIASALRDTGVRIPDYPYVLRLERRIKEAVVPSVEQVMQHIILAEALELLSQFVMDVEAVVLEEAERLARERRQKSVTTDHIREACKKLGKWFGC